MDSNVALRSLFLRLEARIIKFLSNLGFRRFFTSWLAVRRHEAVDYQLRLALAATG
jgi:hypothetical protein